MAHSRVSSARAILFTTLLSAVVCLTASCTDGVTEPSEGHPSLSIVSGGGQSGRAGEELAEPLIIRATDAQGRVLTGVTVVFVVTQGGGSLYATGVLTNTLGYAQNFWTLGPTPGAPQAVEVRSVDPATGRKQVHGILTATATP